MRAFLHVVIVNAVCGDQSHYCSFTRIYPHKSLSIQLYTNPNYDPQLFVCHFASCVCISFQTGSISEQEFAMRIEKDLHSQHQPSLLPFLQVCTVPLVHSTL